MGNRQGSIPECLTILPELVEYILFQATGLRAMANLLGDFMNATVPGSKTDWENIKKLKC